MIATLMEMVVNGVSTRKVARITEELCGTSFSASTISQLCKDLDVSLKSWKDRDLSKTTYPFLILDGIVIKVREDGKVRPFSLLVATGINQERYRGRKKQEQGQKHKQQCDRRNSSSNSGSLTSKFNQRAILQKIKDLIQFISTLYTFHIHFMVVFKIEQTC